MSKSSNVTEDDKQSFFGIFSFYGMMHDAADYFIQYEDIEIENDIDFGVHGKLVKGQRFENVHNCLDTGMFEFLNWELKDDAKVWNPDSSSVYIPQSELAVHCFYR